MSRIFLSHSSRNNAEALALREWLASQGWNDVFLDIDPVRGLVAADRWQKALSSAIGRCRAVIFLLSPEWRASEHCMSEFDLAGHVGAERVGVIIKDIPLDKLPVGLGGENQVINLAQGGKSVSFTVSPPPDRNPVTVGFPEEDLLALREGLARLGLVGFETESFPWPPQDEPDRSPFRGLQALDVKDAGVFFGRDPDLVRAREHLIRLRAEGGRKLFVIQGASGSGKSSFMRAGLLPRLEREDRDFITIPLMRPGAAAISGKSGLAAALEQAFDKLRTPRPFGDLLTALEIDADALPPLMNQLQVIAMQRLVGYGKPQIDRPPSILFAIDQAEELFTPDAGQEAAKMRAHLATALARGPDTICLLTIRSDRFSLIQNDHVLSKLVEPFNLPPIENTVYRDTILKPLTRVVPPTSIEPKLTEALIKDTAAEGADPLPLLAFTLERLFRRHGKSVGGIKLQHYDALGGMSGSINVAIADAFSEPERKPQIPPERHNRERLLELAFVPALVDINPTNREPVSRTAKEHEIPTECLKLVHRLVDARLLVSDDDAAFTNGARTTTYRVAHEALLRRWDWLNGVLDSQAGQLSTAQLIERQADAWLKQNRSPAWLDLRGDRLRDAIAVTSRVGFATRLEGVPAAYIAACQRLERATTWKRRRAYLLVLALVVGVGVTVTSYSKWYPTADAMAYRILNVSNAARKTGEAFRDCSYCPVLVVIPAGHFLMGSSETERDASDERHRDETPQHSVKISEPFAVSKFEVTFEQWDICVAAGACSERAADSGWGRSTRPVINVSWNDITTQYLPWLKKITGQSYRLLSEAEWEYAARGGTTSHYAWGDEIGQGNANCDGCNGDSESVQTAPVGSYKPNPYGLYDMHGNVWEWVQDCYADTYKKAPPKGDTGLQSVNCSRILRGGSWNNTPETLWSAQRYSAPPNTRNNYIGFRVARKLEPGS